MLIERHPFLLDLSAEEKLQLAEELWMEALMEARFDPSLREHVTKRLKNFEGDLAHASPEVRD